MLNLLLAVFATFVITYAILELYPRKIPVDKVFKIVDHKELALKFPEKVLKKHGWKYLIVPDITEQNIRGLVIEEHRNVWDKKTNKRRHRIKVIPLNSPNKVDWEWADFYDKIKGKIEPILIADGTAMLLLSKQPNKQDDENIIAWWVKDPSYIDRLREDAKVGRTVEGKYYDLKRRHDALQTDYERIYSEYESTRLKLRDVMRELEIKDKNVVYMEGEIRRLQLEIQRLDNENRGLRNQLERIIKLVESDADELLLKKLKAGVLIHETKSEVVPEGGGAVTPTPTSPAPAPTPTPTPASAEVEE